MFLSFCHLLSGRKSLCFGLFFTLTLLGKKSKQVPVPHSTCTGKEKRKRQKVSSAEKERDLNILSQHDELVIAEILGPNPPTNNAHSTRTLAHPHFGGKQPKQHQPPKCISVVCREEKKIEDQLRDARQEVEKVQMELEEAQAELSESKFMIGLPILLMFVKTMTITKTGIVINGFLVSKETVVLRRWGRSKQKFGFIKRVDKC